MMRYSRARRVAELIHSEIGIMLQKGVKDPRLKGNMVTVVEVEVTNDLKKATVFVSVYGSDDEKKEVMQGLKSAAGFIKRNIFKTLALKRPIDIIFHLDDRLDYAMKIEELIRETDRGNSQ